MTFQQATVGVPLNTHIDGSVRIGNTRVLLEVVIRAFQRGKTPESIVESFPSLQLDEVYAVIAYYLHNRVMVNEYVQQVESDAESIRETIEASQTDLNPLRKRLLAALAEKQDG